MPLPGFQAVVLCGPGLSLNPFTSNPEDFPKALVPIANRPMVWYAIDWCYRMGITNITLITPPSAAPPLEAALSQNPHLTSLSTHKPALISPVDLDLNTPTAAIFRLLEVKAAITGDFVVVPCDLVCDLPGEKLLSAWMVRQGTLGGKPIRPARIGVANDSSVSRIKGGENSGRRGGMGVWYETIQPGEKPPKGAETDFIITASASPPAVPSPGTSLGSEIFEVCYACTTDTLRDNIADSANNSFTVRSSLLRRHNGKINMRTTCRDAHIYIFPHWVLDFIERNPRMEILSEDVLGWWGKATWQSRKLARYLQLDKTLGWIHDDDKSGDHDDDDDGSPRQAGNGETQSIEKELDILSLSSTHTSSLTQPTNSSTSPKPTVPPILAYIHPPPSSTSALLLRVDNPSLLLSTSLALAALPPTSPTESQSAFAHATKLHPSSPIPAHCTIDPLTVLLAPNTTLHPKTTIKSSCIGSACYISEKCRIERCLLMDGVVLEEGVSLADCTLGPRAKVGKGSRLVGCSVQGGFVVEAGTESKGETMVGFEGLEEGENGELGVDLDVGGDGQAMEI